MLPSLKQLSTLETPCGPIVFELKRSLIRKGLTIAINDKGEIRVLASQLTSGAQIHQFVLKKADWIHHHLAKIQKKNEILNNRKFESGEEFSFLGKKYKLEVLERDVSRTQLTFDSSKWIVCLPLFKTNGERQELVKGKLIKWYQWQAKEILGGRIFHYSRTIGVEPKKIVVKTQKRLWGSCDYRKKTIHLNWQIIMSPISVIDYVIVHELCHLIVPNHSKRFWKRVAEVLPNYASPRKWLNTYGWEMKLS